MLKGLYLNDLDLFLAVDLFFVAPAVIYRYVVSFFSHPCRQFLDNDLDSAASARYSFVTYHCDFHASTPDFLLHNSILNHYYSIIS